ncbi:UV radiation resistance protein and autophagy-related subunit 14-domain-containing protein [Irpex rosettiformis]|uniref:UV radiation resistance protein and autophagy-related subunit 14-domain-containing protein n=1 Tax=Irpex rosettiformis TaxID=378272 RepID=A0ACB8U7C3_9APHY|nr:UV radiation resistance protein and autophagy-related subunit 14-domain-containing protein [Irpex rosettiformis]
MPASGKLGRTLVQGNDEYGGLQRRIRHITSLQVRNFTPFPVRDEFASALIQPSEQPQFTAHGHLSDDLDLSVNRRRGRGRSSTSVSTISWQQAPGYEPQDASQSSGRKRTISRASAASTTAVGATSIPKGRSSGHSVPAATRPPLRQRTLSTASSISVGTSRSHDIAVHPTLSLSGFLQDTSQEALEHILQSRLAETFLTLRAVSPETYPSEFILQQPPSGNRPPAVNGHEGIKTHRRSSTASLGSSSLSRGSTVAKTTTSLHTTSPRAGPSGHSKSISLSASPNDKGRSAPSATKPLSQYPAIPRGAASPKIPSSPFSAPSNSDSLLGRPIPDYISPISKSSTNPRFEIDPLGGFEFAPSADLGATKVVVELWGRLSHDVHDKGKGKERAHPLPGLGREDEGDWQTLKTWEVDLNKLVLLTDDLTQHFSQLPSNTLCVTLEPFGRTYYVPTARPSTTLFRHSRSPSPSAGYNSDPESNTRHMEVRTPLTAKRTSDSQDERTLDEASHPGSHIDVEEHTHWKRPRTSASWQSIIKLVTLQAVIQDTERSVADLGREIAPYLVDRSTVALNREVSEREAWVNDLWYQRALLQERADDVRRRLKKKCEELESRRKMLSTAYEVHREGVHEESEQKIHVEEAGTDLTLLRSQLAPIRNELLTSLAFIFPIELLSPPELLFTILDVPLPIPSGPTDPAPPLSVPSRKDVTEDSVATALGYAAQLVQLLAAYLGQRLIYPVTCVGSRSVIKDGISAMVGPRMFPLFSKGVDTYRFEYGVFLLNKDIEMLMSEHDLRALDMRHTLPNLKNLLLTLTNPDSIAPRRAFFIRTSTTISALQSPMLTPDVTIAEPDSMDSKVLDSPDVSTLDGPTIEIDSPPASGSTTPTIPTPTSTVRKSRAFLDLTPLSGFWRSRNPPSSSSRSSGKVEPPLEDDHAGEATPTISSTSVIYVQTQEESVVGSSDDEDDRETIHASAGWGESGDEMSVSERKTRSKVGSKSLVNGRGNGVGPGHETEMKKEEKVVGQLSMEPHVVDGARRELVVTSG